MTDRIESQGKTVDEAVSEALLQLGARRDEVTVEVLDEGKGGLLGIFGSRPARVVVARKGQGAGRQAAAGRGRSGRSSDRRDGGSGEAPRARQDRPQSGAAAPREARSGQDRERDGGRGRGRRRGGRRRGERGADGARDGGPAAEAAAGERAARRRPRGGERERDAERRPRPESRSGPEPGSERGVGTDRGPVRSDDALENVGPEVRAVELVTPLRDVAPEDAPAALERLTTELMRLGGFPCRVTVEPGEYHLVKVVTDDTGAGVLIGRHGTTVDALEHVVERMIGQAVGDRVNMNLDVNNYRRRRQEALVERTQQLVQQVRQTGREIHMEPLSPRERRIVHLEVAGVRGLRTYTLGGEGGRHVVIAPEGEGPDGPRDERDEADGREGADGGDDRWGGDEAGAPDAGGAGGGEEAAAPRDDEPTGRDAGGAPSSDSDDGPDGPDAGWR